jgi:hypothetical protein
MRKRGKTRYASSVMIVKKLVSAVAFFAFLSLAIPSAYGMWSMGTYGTCDYDAMPFDGCTPLVTPSSCSPPNAWPEGADCYYGPSSGMPGNCGGGWHCIAGYWVYVDNDRDGYAVAASGPHVTVREGNYPPDGWAEAVGDCNDNDYSTHPGGYDSCGNGKDEDCNGADRPCCSESFLNSAGWGGNVGCTGVMTQAYVYDASKGCDNAAYDKQSGNTCASCNGGYRFFAINVGYVLFSAPTPSNDVKLPRAESFSPLDKPILHDLLSEVSLRPPNDYYYTACYPIYSTRGYTCYEPRGIPSDPQRVQHRNIDGSWDSDTNSWICGTQPDNSGCSNYFCWYTSDYSALNGAYSCNNGGSITTGDHPGYCVIGKGGSCSTNNNCYNGNWCSGGRCCPNGQRWNGATCASGPLTCPCAYQMINGGSPNPSYFKAIGTCVNFGGSNACLRYTNGYYGPGTYWYTKPYTTG